MTELNRLIKNTTTRDLHLNVKSLNWLSSSKRWRTSKWNYQNRKKPFKICIANTHRLRMSILAWLSKLNSWTLSLLSTRSLWIKSNCTSVSRTKNWKSTRSSTSKRRKWFSKKTSRWASPSKVSRNSRTSTTNTRQISNNFSNKRMQNKNSYKTIWKHSNRNSQIKTNTSKVLPTSFKKRRSQFKKKINTNKIF